jgi:hypothetical protein
VEEQKALRQLENSVSKEKKEICKNCVLVCMVSMDEASESAIKISSEKPPRGGTEIPSKWSRGIRAVIKEARSKEKWLNPAAKAKLRVTHEAQLSEATNSSGRVWWPVPGRILQIRRLLHHRTKRPRERDEFMSGKN